MHQSTFAIRFIVFAVLLCVGALGVSNAYARDAGAYWGLHFGAGVLDLDGDASPEPRAVTAFSAGLQAGYLFKNQLFLESTYTRASNFSLFGASERYGLRHWDAALGYRFAWKYLSLSPSLGYVDWKITQKDGQLFNPGVENSERLKGQDSVVGLTLGYTSSPDYELAAIYKHFDSEVGEVVLWNLGLLFRL